MPRNTTTTDCQELLNQATMYYEGIGVEQSVRKAFTLFEQIAKSKTKKNEVNKQDVKSKAKATVAKAQYMLGFMYKHGQGVERSNTIANEWWAQSAANGDEEAINVLKLLKDYERRRQMSLEECEKRRRIFKRIQIHSYTHLYNLN